MKLDETGSNRFGPGETRQDWLNQINAEQTGSNRITPDQNR